MTISSSTLGTSFEICGGQSLATLPGAARMLTAASQRPGAMDARDVPDDPGAPDGPGAPDDPADPDARAVRVSPAA